MGADPRAEFLQRLAASEAARALHEAAPTSYPPLESDTASGDIRVAIVKLTERSHSTAATIEEIKAMLSQIHRNMSQLVVRQAAVDAADQQIHGIMESIRRERSDDREAIARLQRWQGNLKASTAAWVTAATSIGALAGFILDHTHIKL